MRVDGNALFLILIAVALFAALSYAVTQSGRGGGGIEREKRLLASAQLLDFAGLVKATVDRLMILNNVEEYMLRYNNNAGQTRGGSYINGALGTPADPSLYVFHPQGGGVTARVFPELSEPCDSCVNSNWQSGHFGIRWGRVEGVGTTAGDMILMVNYLTSEACRDINARLGIAGTPVAEVDSSTSVTAPPPALSAMSGADAAALAGKESFCFSGTGGYQFVHVLSAN